MEKRTKQEELHRGEFALFAGRRVVIHRGTFAQTASSLNCP
jgi:hypothetical protein